MGCGTRQWPTRWDLARKRVMLVWIVSIQTNAQHAECERSELAPISRDRSRSGNRWCAKPPGSPSIISVGVPRPPGGLAGPEMGGSELGYARHFLVCGTPPNGTFRAGLHVVTAQFIVGHWRLAEFCFFKYYNFYRFRFASFSF